jgi:multicomponent Na+:H+ antiporter subunit D
VLAQLQLLMFSALAFSVLMRTGIYPPELRAVNLDFDWSYRMLGFTVVRRISEAISAFMGMLSRGRSRALRGVIAVARRLYAPGAVFARTWPSGSTALWMMVLLLGLLLSGYFA